MLELAEKCITVAINHPKSEWYKGIDHPESRDDPEWKDFGGYRCQHESLVFRAIHTGDDSIFVSVYDLRKPVFLASYYDCLDAKGEKVVDHTVDVYKTGTWESVLDRLNNETP